MSDLVERWDAGRGGHGKLGKVMSGGFCACSESFLLSSVLPAEAIGSGSPAAAFLLFGPVEGLEVDERGPVEFVSVEDEEVTAIL